MNTKHCAQTQKQHDEYIVQIMVAGSRILSLSTTLVTNKITVFIKENISCGKKYWYPTACIKMPWNRVSLKCSPNVLFDQIDDLQT